MRPAPPSPAALIALAVGVVCIGWSAIFVKLASVPGPAASFYRVLVAAVVLTPFWLATSPMAPTRRALGLTTLCGLWFAADLSLWNAGLLHTTAANATLLANLAPVWVGLGTALLGEALPRRFWRGMTLAVVGSIIIAGPWGRTTTPNPGDMMALGASFFYAAYLLSVRRARVEVDTMSFMVLSMWVSVVVLAVACLLLGTPLTGYSPLAWRALLGLGLVSQLGGWIAITYALGHIRAPVASVTLLGQPVLTAVFAAVVLNEVVGARTGIGGALVLTGIFLVVSRTTRPVEAELAPIP
jgi:drug/metabolite transporter (DMT)-like permease